MSTVVGVRTEKNIWIGADSRASTESGEIRPFVAQKVFTNGPYLVGFIGSVRGGQLIRPEYFKPPQKVFDWPAAIIHQYEKNYCLAVDSETQTSMMACNFIIGDSRTKKMYEILVDFQMNEIEEISAIGSGSTYAFGSLHTTGELNINGHDRVKMALESAMYFDAATGGPLNIQKLKKSE